MQEVRTFTDSSSPAGLRVFALGTEELAVKAIYPDYSSFLADGRRFIVNSQKGPMICDPDQAGALQPIFSNARNQSIMLDPGGNFGYFERPTTDQDKGRITIARVDLITLQAEDVFHAENKLPGTDIAVERFKLSTVSAGGQRLAGRCWLGDGQTRDAPFGLVVLDLATGEATIIWAHCDFYPNHLRYCLSSEPEASHDLLLQMNHGAHLDADGKVTVSLGPPSEGGMDLHIIRDDGTNRCDLPFGRDGVESCIGHQVWRGFNSRSVATITLQSQDNSYGWAEGTAQEILAGDPMPVSLDAPHLGRLTQGDGCRIDLSEGFAKPRFCHLSCDATGLNLAFDTFPVFDGKRAGMQVYYGRADSLTEPLQLRYLLNSGNTFNPNYRGNHAHPVISPDASFILFNTAISGINRAYLVTGFAE